jgi:hypothetical protein
MDQKELAKWREINRMLALTQWGARKTDLLTDAMNGADMTVANVKKMFEFYVTNIGSGALWRQGTPTGQDIITPLWNECVDFFQSAGLSDEEIDVIKHPKPSGYKNILEELEAEE